MEGPIAYISSILISFFLELKSISNSLNLIPSPVNKSAIPCKDANDKIFVKTGSSYNLKSLIFNLDFEVSFFLIE